MKEYYTAQKYFDKAIQLDRNDVDSWKDKRYNCLAIGYENLKYNEVTDKYLDSLSCVDEAIKLRPDNVELLCIKAMVLVKLNEDDETTKLFDNAIKIDPNSGLAWYYRACFNVMKGNIQQGLSDLEASVKIGGKIVIDLATKEEDFISVRNNERFKSIIK